MKIALAKSIEPGTYKAKLTHYEETNSRFGPCLKFFYKLAGGGEVNELINLRYSSSSKLGQRVMQMTGSLPAEVDLDALIGKVVILELVRQEDKPEYCRIADVKPVTASTGSQQQAPAPAAPAPPAEDEEITYEDGDDFDDFDETDVPF